MHFFFVQTRQTTTKNTQFLAVLRKGINQELKTRRYI
jgi:hypothetical protein